MINISAAVDIERNGVPFAELTIDAESPPTIDMTADAKIKMKLSGSFMQPGFSIDFFNDRLAPYLVRNGVKHSLGKFVFTGAFESTENGLIMIDFESMDLTYLVDKRKIEQRIFIPAGRKYTDVIQEQLTACGIINYRVTPSNATVQTDREDWEPGTSTLDIVNELLNEINYSSLYMDLEGYLVAAPAKDLTVDNITIVYRADEASIVEDGYKRNIDVFNHANVFYLSCDNPDFETPLQATAVNDSPTNMFSTANQGRVAKFISVDNIASQAALQERANQERLKSMISADEIEFTTALNPVHGVNEVVALHTDQYNGILMETYWQMELSHDGAMSHRGKQEAFL